MAATYGIVTSSKHIIFQSFAQKTHYTASEHPVQARNETTKPYQPVEGKEQTFQFGLQNVIFGRDVFVPGRNRCHYFQLLFR